MLEWTHLLVSLQSVLVYRRLTSIHLSFIHSFICHSFIHSSASYSSIFRSYIFMPPQSPLEQSIDYMPTGAPQHLNVSACHQTMAPTRCRRQHSFYVEVATVSQGLLIGAAYSCMKTGARLPGLRRFGCLGRIPTKADSTINMLTHHGTRPHTLVHSLIRSVTLIHSLAHFHISPSRSLTRRTHAKAVRAIKTDTRREGEDSMGYSTRGSIT